MVKAIVLLLGVVLFSWGSFALPDCPEVDDPAHWTLFADPDDCGAYYECAYGTPFKFLCQPGLYYDEAQELCNYPTLVTCGTRPTTPASTIDVA